MQPDFTTIQSIRSINQRNLAVHWLSLCAAGTLPRFADFAPGNRAHDPKQIAVWAVGERNGHHSYSIMYGGQYMIEAFGENATLQSIPPKIRDVFKIGMDGCLAARAITYMLVSTSDDDGHQIDCERLLLPFSEDRDRVTHVLASLQLVSFTGDFRRASVVHHFAREATVTQFSCIRPGVNEPRRSPEREAAV